MTEEWSTVQRPARICALCWDATPGHELVRPFWSYCSHWRILALRPPNATWILHPRVTAAQAAASLQEVLQHIYLLAPQWPELRSTVLQLTRDLRDFETRFLLER
jgi:hypothetical protein